MTEPVEQMIADALRVDEASRALMTFLAHEAGVAFVHKETSEVHQGIASVLDMMRMASAGTEAGVAALESVHLNLEGNPVTRLLTGLAHLPSGDEYLHHMATTIGPTIAMPTAWLDDPARAMTRLITAPHEAQHGHQWRTGAGKTWPSVLKVPLLYLLSPVDRVKFEADAYAAGAAVRRFLTGSAGDLGEIVEALRQNYALDDTAAEAGIAMLSSHFLALDAGRLPPVWAAVKSVEFLRAHAPELEGRVSFEGKYLP